MRQTLASGLEQLPCLTTLSIAIDAFAIDRTFVAGNVENIFNRREVSGCLHKLTGLKQLQLTSCQKSLRHVRLPNSLSALSNLESLAMTDCSATWDFPMPALTEVRMIGYLNGQSLLHCSGCVPALAHLYVWVPDNTTVNPPPMSGLHLLPAVLGNLPCLKSSDISIGSHRQHLGEVSAADRMSPEHAHSLSNLTSLKLHSHYRSTLFPVLMRSLDWVTVLTQLQQLDVQMPWNQQLLTTEEWSPLSQLQQLSSLVLKGGIWHYVPTWLSCLTNLQVLEYGSNAAGAEESVSSMQRASPLARLRKLQRCQLSCLPMMADAASAVLDVMSLTCLTHLKLHWCNLTGTVACAVPHAMMQLQSLVLTCNTIDCLPESVSAMVHLTRLDVESNQLSTLPQAVWSLPQLQVLTASHNQLTTLEVSCGDMRNTPSVFAPLLSLDLGANQLSSVPDWLACFTRLQQLHLNNNQLREIPPAIWRLPRLNDLGLGGNKFMAPHVRQQWPFLEADSDSRQDYEAICAPEGRATTGFSMQPAVVPPLR
eukprot:jgi/Chrzof1/3397/Cz12g23260.t1